MFWCGIILSTIYFVALGVTIHLLHLELMGSWNEFGDFLAGAFSPVAFLWLVLGYLQQQKELQQNTRALELQAEELRNSVEQYKEMVAVARDQLVADTTSLAAARREREIQFKPIINAPILAPGIITGGDKFTYRGQLIIGKEEAYNLSIKTEPEFKPFHDVRRKVLPPGAVDVGNSPEVKASQLPPTILLTISYESRLGVTYSDIYTYILGDGGIFSIVDDKSD